MAKSKYYDLAKKYYDAGLWSIERLQALVAAGKLTQAEYDSIVNG